MRRSLGGSHFYAFGTAVASGALRHRAGGTVIFAKLSNDASSHPPRLVNLLVIARVAPHVVDKLYGFLVWKSELHQSL